MRNMKTIVTNHNKKILNGKDETETTKCNCQQKASCPLKGNCLSTNTGTRWKNIVKLTKLPLQRVCRIIRTTMETKIWQS